MAESTVATPLPEGQKGGLPNKLRISINKALWPFEQAEAQGGSEEGWEMTTSREYVRMKNRAHLSPAETTRIVIKRYEEGCQPYDIANRLGILVGEVRIILKLAGIELEDPVDHVPVHPMWGMDDDARRRAIIRRASDGARKTLSEFSPLSTLSTKTS